MMHTPTQALILGRKPPGPGQKTKLDFPADVHSVPADRIVEAGPDWGGTNGISNPCAKPSNSNAGFDYR